MSQTATVGLNNLLREISILPNNTQTDLLIALKILNHIPFERKFSEQMSLIWWKGLWSSCARAC